MFPQCMSNSGMCPPPHCPPSGMPPGHNSIPPPGNEPYYPAPYSPYMRRPSPFHATTDFKIYEFNKRLQQRPEVCALHRRYPINCLTNLL